MISGAQRKGIEPSPGASQELFLEEVKCNLCGFCSVFRVPRHILFVVCFESCFQNEEARGKGDVSSGGSSRS